MQRKRAYFVVGALLGLLLLLLAKPAYDRYLSEGERDASHRQSGQMRIEWMREGVDFELQLNQTEVQQRLPYLAEALENISPSQGAVFDKPKSEEILHFLQEKAGPGTEWRYFSLAGRHYSVDF